jgi:hypothetical protein
MDRSFSESRWRLCSALHRRVDCSDHGIKQRSTTCSFDATSGSRAQRASKSYGQINHLPLSTQTHRTPLAGARCWSHPTRQRDRVQDGGCRKKCWK